MSDKKDEKKEDEKKHDPHATEAPVRPATDPHGPATKGAEGRADAGGPPLGGEGGAEGGVPDAPPPPTTKPVEPRDSRKPRDAGDMKDPVSEEDITKQREAVDKAIAEGGEVVASDGTKEIILFEPVLAGSVGWAAHNGKKMLIDKVLLKLGDINQSVAIAGFGLLDGAGKQVAWSALSDPVNVQPNTTIGIEDSIVF
jgi:hypothetical protein